MAEMASTVAELATQARGEETQSYEPFIEDDINHRNPYADDEEAAALREVRQRRLLFSCNGKKEKEEGELNAERNDVWLSFARLLMRKQSLPSSSSPNPSHSHSRRHEREENDAIATLLVSSSGRCGAGASRSSASSIFSTWAEESFHQQPSSSSVAKQKQSRNGSQIGSHAKNPRFPTASVFLRDMGLFAKPTGLCPNSPETFHRVRIWLDEWLDVLARSDSEEEENDIDSGRIEPREVKLSAALCVFILVCVACARVLRANPTCLFSWRLLRDILERISIRMGNKIKMMNSKESISDSTRTTCWFVVVWSAAHHVSHYIIPFLEQRDRPAENSLHALRTLRKQQEEGRGEGEAAADETHKDRPIYRLLQHHAGMEEEEEHEEKRRIHDGEQDQRRVLEVVALEGAEEFTHAVWHACQLPDSTPTGETQLKEPPPSLEASSSSSSSVLPSDTSKKRAAADGGAVESVVAALLEKLSSSLLNREKEEAKEGEKDVESGQSSHAAAQVGINAIFAQDVWQLASPLLDEFAEHFLLQSVQNSVGRQRKRR